MVRISRRKHYTHHLDKRLRFRFRIYFAVAIIMLAIIIFDTITGKISIYASILGILSGIGVGVISSRMFHISWNHDAQKIVSRLDEYGIVILVFYIVFELNREWIVGHFVQGQVLGTASFTVLAGIMIGRVLGTRGRILQILKEQKVFA